MAEQSTIDVSTLGKKVENPLGAAAGIISPEATARVAKEVGVVGQPPQTPPAVPPAAGAQPNAIPPVPQPIVVETPFGQQVIDNGTPTNAQPNVMDMTAFMAKVSEVVGTPVQSLEDVMSKVITPFTEVRGEVTKKAELEGRLNTVVNILAQMPEDMRAVFNAFINNEDYRSVMSTMVRSQSLDFKKRFEEHDPRSLVNHYSGRNLSQEDWGALDDSVKDMLLVSAKTMYTSESSKINTLSSKNDTVTQRQQQVVDSVENSIKHLKSLYPSMPNHRVEEIRRSMFTSINGRLYNTDGTYKPSAAVDIATMLYGQEAIAAQTVTINQLVEKARSAGISQGYERAVSVSDTVPQHRAGGGAAPDQIVAQEVQKTTGFLKGSAPGVHF